MKIKVIYRFRDLQENLMREVGEEYDATQERADFLIRRGLVEPAENSGQEGKNPERAKEEATEVTEKPKRPRKKKE